MPTTEKDRLYVALYARDHPLTAKWQDKYFWALMVGPKIESPDSYGYRFNVTQIRPHRFFYEVWHTPMNLSSTLLVRVMVGKVRDMSRIRALLANTPLREDDAAWNCIEWVREALLAAFDDKRALKTTVTDWESVRNAALWFVRSKESVKRFDDLGPGEELAPAWDLMKGKELVA